MTEGEATSESLGLDTPAVLEARRLNELSYLRTGERGLAYKPWVDLAYGSGASQKGSRCDIVLGPPASGKSSTLVGPLAEAFGSLIVDCDLVKPMIPEYENGLMAGRVHQESSDIADNVLVRAVQIGDNIVLPVVGRNASRIAEMIELLREQKYTVFVHFVDLPPVTAARRAAKRFEETGRFVDPAYVLRVGTSPSRTFDMIKREGLADGYSHWSTNVNEGDPAQRIEIYGEDTLPASWRSGS